MNPRMAGPVDVDQITEAGPGCPCHDTVDCLDEAAVTITVRELAGVGEVLADIDELLRCGNGVAELLTDFRGRHGDPHPRFAAATLVDAVGFAALTAPRLLAEGGHVGGRS